jgi:chromosome partitioning protein
MIVISVANQKGGAGKSTLTLILATALSVDYGFKVLVLDADTFQQTLSQSRLAYDQPDLEEERKTDPTRDFPYPIVGLPISEVYDYVDTHGDAYDVIFIDFPGRADDDQVNEVLGICNVVLVPMNATGFDRLATMGFANIIKAMGIECAKENIPFQYFGVSSRRTQSKEEAEMEEFADDLELPRFKAALRRVTAFERPSSLYSYSNANYRRRIGAAREISDEVRAMAEELITRIDLKKTSELQPS